MLTTDLAAYLTGETVTRWLDLGQPDPTSVTENGRDHPLMSSTRIEMRFDVDGRQVHVRAKCNSISGNGEIRGARLVVTDTRFTNMGCDPARHEQDEWLGRLLEAQPGWRLSGDDLLLNSGAVQVRLDADR